MQKGLREQVAERQRRTSDLRNAADSANALQLQLQAGAPPSGRSRQEASPTEADPSPSCGHAGQKALLQAHTAHVRRRGRLDRLHLQLGANQTEMLNNHFPHLIRYQSLTYQVQ